MLKFSGYPYLIRGQKTLDCAVLPAKKAAAAQQQVGSARHQQPRHYPGGGTHNVFTTPGLCEDCVRHSNSRGSRQGMISFLCTSLNTKLAQKYELEVFFDDARTGMPPGIPEGAMCVQRFDDSLNTAIHTTYRISLRSSSMREPRDPLLKVLSYFLNFVFRQLNQNGL